MTVKAPALRWRGGKWRIAPWIIENLPPHEGYCEPFAGAGSVLLRKPPSDFECLWFNPAALAAKEVRGPV